MGEPKLKIRDFQHLNHGWEHASSKELIRLEMQLPYVSLQGGTATADYDFSRRRASLQDGVSLPRMTRHEDDSASHEQRREMQYFTRSCNVLPHSSELLWPCARAEWYQLK